jgi:hypothetical protein
VNVPRYQWRVFECIEHDNCPFQVSSIETLYRPSFHIRSLFAFGTHLARFMHPPFLTIRDHATGSTPSIENQPLDFTAGLHPLSFRPTRIHAEIKSTTSIIVSEFSSTLTSLGPSNYYIDNHHRGGVAVTKPCSHWCLLLSRESETRQRAFERTSIQDHGRHPPVQTEVSLPSAPRA